MRQAVSVDVLALMAPPEGGHAGVRELRAAAEKITDEDLVKRARHGDRWAEEAIYRRYVTFIAGLALRLLRQQAEAEDVTQEVFALALEQIGKLRDPAALRSWLAQIAVSRVRRRFRRQRLLRALGIDRSAVDADFASLVSSESSAEVRAELARLDRVLAQLPREQRIAWTLRHVEGEPLEDVARACDCSIATAKRRISAAEARIQLHVRLSEAAT
jgi:RNA polymerase sigma-70 factor (ECF subfamily)